MTGDEYPPVARRTLDDGREITVDQMAFGNYRLNISSDPGYTYDDGYCYHGLLPALAAHAVWDGVEDPVGWVRHLRTGRRRPDGDASQEYQAW